MKTSEKIKQRLIDKKIRFFANDNISKHIEKGELKDLEVEIEEAFEDILDALVIDTENDHNSKETAKRVAKMYINEIFS